MSESVSNNYVNTCSNAYSLNITIKPSYLIYSPEMLIADNLFRFWASDL